MTDRISKTSVRAWIFSVRFDFMHHASSHIYTAYEHPAESKLHDISTTGRCDIIALRARLVLIS